MWLAKQTKFLACVCVFLTARLLKDAVHACRSALSGCWSLNKDREKIKHENMETRPLSIIVLFQKTTKMCLSCVTSVTYYNKTT